jgi:hypothetical protein
VSGNWIRINGFPTWVEARRALEKARRVLERWRSRARSEMPGANARIPLSVRSLAGRIIMPDTIRGVEGAWGIELLVPTALGADGARVAAHLVRHALVDRGTQYVGTTASVEVIQ